jgi:hypothetical protein
MATARDLCVEALTVSGVVGDGQTASGMIINATFARMNRMLSQWQIKRWLIYHLVEHKFVGDGTKGGDGAPIIVGPGGDINMVRPDRIEKAFQRQTILSQPNQIDYPLEEMKSYEDWTNIALKTLKSFPSYFFYDPAFPLGKLYVWPVMSPAGLYEAHIITKEVLGRFASLASAVLLPPEYEGAITWNLARITRAAFRKPMDAEINALARENLNSIRSANAAIARLEMPDDLTRPGIYNIFSDQIR